MNQPSSVLVVGAPTIKAGDVGAGFARDFAQAKSVAQAHPPLVVVFSGRESAEFEDFCRFLKERCPLARWILSVDSLKPSKMIELVNSEHLQDVIDGFDDPTLEKKIQEAFEEGGRRLQQRSLEAMFNDQTLQLQRLREELNTRIERRQKTLRKSRLTLRSTRTRLEAFHRALLGIHRAESVSQMEQTLNDSLQPVLPGIRAMIRFSQQSSLTQTSAGEFLRVEIPFTDPHLRGDVLFSTSGKKKFSPTEIDFLHEICEALALALTRLHKLELAETIKSQWQATFDSITHPLCLTTADFEIIKLNKAFQQACPQSSFRALIGKNCFQVFFKDDFKPPVATGPQISFRASREGPSGLEHFEVTADVLGLSQSPSARLVLIRSVTEEVRFERRILEASKLAELGTIGSSIAHELNNPLGGMLSFLQLVMMDLPKSDPKYADLKSMEEATIRCRDIVQNLLSFARKQDLGELTEIDLWSVIDRAVKLIELQSKSKGIKIEIRHGPRTCVLGSVNALSQAVCNLLQNAIDAISERMSGEPLYPGRITIEISPGESNIQLRIHDNGPGIRPEVQSRIFNPLFTTRDPGLFNGMGLTTAFTIISEHNGSLEILSQTGSGTTAIVSLPRLDLSPERRLFDGEI